MLLENHSIDLSKSQKLSELRSGPFTITKRITPTTYELTLDSDSSTKKTVHRNHLIEYFPKAETLPQLVTNYASFNEEWKDFYKRLLKYQSSVSNQNTRETDYTSLDLIPAPILPITQFNHPPVRPHRPDTPLPKRTLTDSGLDPRTRTSRTLKNSQILSDPTLEPQIVSSPDPRDRPLPTIPLEYSTPYPTSQNPISIQTPQTTSVPLSH